MTRLVGDLQLAEDSVQAACTAAVVRWPLEGVPANPGAWLMTVAHRHAVDWLRREVRRSGKEAAALRHLSDPSPAVDGGGIADDQLRLIFMCCHPAFDPGVRVALTLRSVCGLTTAEIAAAFLLPEPTMAQRLVRAKRKIRQAGIPFRVPPPDELDRRLGTVLTVIRLVFTEGHTASSGQSLVRSELCEEATRLARVLAELLPGEPEVEGLLSLLLLVDARRPARLDGDGDLVLLEDQDRSLWDRAKISEGAALVERALGRGRVGPYQLQAAIAACHSTAAAAGATDWREIAALYGELMRHEPTPVVEANRAVAVAMAEGPAAGLAILDRVAVHAQLSRWPQLHIARADLLRRLGRDGEAVAAYRRALALELPAGARAFIARRIEHMS